MDRLEAWIYRNKVFVAFELGILMFAGYVLFAFLMAQEEREIAAAEDAPDAAPAEPAVAEPEVRHDRRAARR